MENGSDSRGPYGYELVTDVMVPMRDGVQLATDLYFPTDNGNRLSEKLPVIMVRTPYNKSRAELPTDRRCTGRLTVMWPCIRIREDVTTPRGSGIC